MTIQGATDVAHVPAIDHREAMRLAAVENERLVAAVRTLTPEDWSRPTDNHEWDVRAMLLHALGTMEANASFKENVSQLRRGAKWAKAQGRDAVDGVNQIQIDDRQHLIAGEIVDGLARQAPRAVRGRTRTPALVRKMVRFKVELPGIAERWNLGFLIDIIYTRDTWMHRVDLARAIGGELVLDADHDGRIVADVVADWARRHGQPFELVLTGPAGGTYVTATSNAPEQLELDAVEFCRIVSGRASGTGLLTQVVPF